jgi:hypothetical protein
VEIIGNGLVTVLVELEGAGGGWWYPTLDANYAPRMGYPATVPRRAPFATRFR